MTLPKGPIFFILCLILFISNIGFGQENGDLNFIPDSVYNSSSSPHSNKPTPELLLKDDNSPKFRLKNSAEQTLIFVDTHKNLALPLPVKYPEQRSLTNLDYRIESSITPTLEFQTNGRLQVRYDDGIREFYPENFQNFLKELYFSIKKGSELVIDVGRVNVKNGVALGYNPTDFFKSRTQILQLTMDPTALRSNRLGSALIQSSLLHNQSAISGVISPSFTKMDPLETTSSGWSPRWGSTNSTARYLLKYSQEWNDFSPQLILFQEENQSMRLGFNITRTLSKNTTFYWEWAGGSQKKLSLRALEFGKSTGAIANNQLDIINSNSNSNPEFQNDLATGFSWVSDYPFTLNIEYHYHESGLTTSQIHDLITAGQTQANIASLFWYLRQFASEQQELLVQEQIFFRIEFQDLIWKHHALSLLYFLNPKDNSSISQLLSEFQITDSLIMANSITGYWGDLKSEKGSLPPASNLGFRLTYFF